MRAKRNIPARMDRCHAYWFEAPMLNKGKWRQACGFAPDAKLWLEIGCGKGDSVLRWLSVILIFCI